MENKNRENTILIVDDDNFILDMYSLKFKEQGFGVDTAIDSKQALIKLREGFSPSVILFDMVMPNIDGLEFLEIVNNEKLAENSVLIAISNQWEESYIEKAKQLGVDDYIIKADTIPSEVVARVKEVMKNHNKN